MDNYNGQNEFQKNTDMQQPNMQQNMYQQPNMQQPNMQQNMYQQPNMQQNMYQQPNMQQNMYQQPNMQQNMYQQPNMYQNPYMQNGQYVKPKSNAWKVVLIILLILALVVGGSILAITACVGTVMTSTVSGYVDKSKYSKDINALDSINTAVRTYVADPSAYYVDGRVYTLTELMVSDCDPKGIIITILGDGDIIDTDSSLPYDFYCASEVFEGTTTDDVLVCINNGAVSIYVPANKKYADEFDSYKVGTEFADKD